MKKRPGLTVIFPLITAALFATMPAQADDSNSGAAPAGNQSVEAPAADSSAAAAVETPASDSSTEAPMDTSDAEPAADIESDSNADSEAPKAPPPTAKELYDGMIAISPPGGMQVPAAPDADQSKWQTVNVGFASMRVPADWTVQNTIGKAGDEDQTIGLSPPSNDIYIELRQIQNADSNYEQTPADLAQSDYGSSPGRLKDGVILGFQPMVLDGAVGNVEIMNQYGKPKNDDGTPTFRMITWHGRWEQNDAIQRVEFNATFAQDQYERVAPAVSGILATVKTSEAIPEK